MIHFVHNLLLSIYAQFQSIKKHKTFLCLLSRSFKNCRFEKNDLKVEENGTSKNVCKLSNKDSDFIG